MSHVAGEGLSASNSSGVTGGVSVSQGAVGVPSFSGVTLALGRGLRTDRCQRMSDGGGYICCRGRF